MQYTPTPSCFHWISPENTSLERRTCQPARSWACLLLTAFIYSAGPWELCAFLILSLLPGVCMLLPCSLGFYLIRAVSKEYACDNERMIIISNTQPHYYYLRFYQDLVTFTQGTINFYQGFYPDNGSVIPHVFWWHYFADFSSWTWQRRSSMWNVPYSRNLVVYWQVHGICGGRIALKWMAIWRVDNITKLVYLTQRWKKGFCVPMPKQYNCQWTSLKYNFTWLIGVGVSLKLYNIVANPSSQNAFTMETLLTYEIILILN